MASSNWLYLSADDQGDLIKILADADHFKVAFWNDAKGKWEIQGLTFSPKGLAMMIKYVSDFRKDCSYQTLRKHALTWSRL